jgi:hypothetical protein
MQCGRYLVAIGGDYDAVAAVGLADPLPHPHYQWHASH